jgi:myo-inositol-1(or 4)-monophosphatase
MLAHVAAGRYDAFLEPHMNAWDALAGLLLIDEAGGRALPYPAPGGLASGGAGARRGAGYFRRAGPSVAARRQRRLSAATPIT